MGVVVLTVLLVATSILSVWLYVELERERERERPPGISYECRKADPNLASPPPYAPPMINDTHNVTQPMEPADLKDMRLCPEGQLPIPLPIYRPKGVVGHSPDYFYAAASSSSPADRNDGGGVTTWVEIPAVSSESGTHSIFEISVQGGTDDGDIVEIGWIREAGSLELFVFHWIGWNPTCYNGCGWVQWNPNIVAGSTWVPLLQHWFGAPSYMGYVYYAPQGNWWAWYMNQWLGYFPGSEWGGSYTQTSLIQWFGEVYEDDITPDSDMGNGYRASSTNAAKFWGPCEVDANAWVCWIDSSPALSGTQTWYTIQSAGGHTYRYGGPGAASGAGLDP